MPPALAVVGAVASVVGTVASISAQNKSRRAQQAQQALERRRSARANIREAQIARASALAGAQGAGSIGGSGAAGGIGSIGSRLGGALGYSSQQSALSNIVTKQEQRAATWSGIAQLGGVAYEAGGGAPAVASSFGYRGKQPNLGID